MSRFPSLLLCIAVAMWVVGCAKPNPRVVQMFASRNHSKEMIRITSVVGFEPEMVGLGGVLIPVDPRDSGFTSVASLGRTYVPSKITIVWVNGDTEEGAEHYQQDVAIPDELLAKHNHPEDMLGFTFGADSKWSVKLIPYNERGW